MLSEQTLILEFYAKFIFTSSPSFCVFRFFYDILGQNNLWCALRNCNLSNDVNFRNRNIFFDFHFRYQKNVVTGLDPPMFGVT